MWILNYLHFLVFCFTIFPLLHFLHLPFSALLLFLSRYINSITNNYSYHFCFALHFVCFCLWGFSSTFKPVSKTALSPRTTDRNVNLFLIAGYSAFRMFSTEQGLKWMRHKRNNRNKEMQNSSRPHWQCNYSEWGIPLFQCTVWNVIRWSLLTIKIV